jgi:hypothetical protein
VIVLSAAKVSRDQLIVLLVIGLLVVSVMGIWYRPLLFASVDPRPPKRGVSRSAAWGCCSWSCWPSR